MKIIIGCLTLVVFLLYPAVSLENPEQKVAGAIRSYIIEKQPDYAQEEIKISFKFSDRLFKELEQMPDNTLIKVRETPSEFKPVGNVTFPLSLDSGGEIKNAFVRTRVEVIRKIAAAARRIKKGKVLEEADLKLEERDVALLPQKYFADTITLVNKEAKISIPANSTIFEWMVGEQPLIKRGSMVDVLVVSSGLTVKVRGTAMEDGYRDLEIKVKRQDSKKIIIGKVVSASEVEVKP